MPRVRRSNCAAPGITRARRGRGFEYRDAAGTRIDDGEVLARISALAIPPAWREVWICADARGHLQATGIDAAGRKQYLYHDRWRAHRDRLKFDAMLAFARAQPRLRRRVTRDLRLHAGAAKGAEKVLSRDRVLACAVRLLDLGFFRIGSDEYAEANESYGLTTMLREHVRVRGRELVFDFTAKSGRRRVQAIADPDVLAVVTRLKRRRAGGRLLAYRDGRAWTEIDAAAVNDYIKSHTGQDFSAKDFRTWNASVLAAVALARSSPAQLARGSQRRAVSAAIKVVAEYLGNTPAVTRASYVDPRLIDRFEAGITIAPALEALGSRGPDLSDQRVRSRIEAAVLDLLAEEA
jgi:DNA topoisomerase I